MGIVNSIIDYFMSFRRNKEQRKLTLLNEYKQLISFCEEALVDYNNLFNRNIYIDYHLKDKWKTDYMNLYKETDRVGRYKKVKISEEEKQKIPSFRDLYSNFEQKCRDYNNKFVANEKIIFKDLFDTVEGRALDDQQRDCAIKDEVNNLVIAGAGSGKTTTIVGKVKYLLKRYKYNPEELLVLSFTNASASEMRERILKETGKDIDVMTFHKLGLEIISAVEGKKPSLTDIEMEDFIKEKFNTLTKDSRYNNLLNKYFLSYMKPYKNKFEFKTEGDYIDYLRDANIRTFKNEIVKSFEEMEIANFFFINNIDYKYEEKYKYKTANRKHSQYKPDFYLPDYDIYIEHFGIDRKGNVPKFFQGKDGKSAKQIYNEGIEWKRELHEENNTILIETYSWEKEEGFLTDNLSKKLEKVGVKLNPMSRNELWKLIENDQAYELTSFVKLMTTFINLLKTNNYSIESIKQKNNNYYTGYKRMRNEAFVNLIAPLYEDYQKMLEVNQEIDFSDMINKACAYVKEGRFNKKYSYIIVDEYQDISLPRFNLIKAIKDQNKSKLFCVGDDFQSIYRFAGSNISLFTKFEKYFGYTEKSFIETTYRFNKNLIDLSSNFILKNKAQVKKQLRPYNDNNEKSFELVYVDDRSELPRTLKEKLRQLPNDTSVALLGRYKNDLKIYLDNDLTFKYDRHRKKGIVAFGERKDIDIEFLTVHKSKGLQADYVFILNNSNSKHGFPSQLEDDPVLELLVTDNEIFEFAEERRLFYVALTRAKKYLYLMVNKKTKSCFIREIETDYKIKEDDDEEIIPCPICRKGKLLYKQGIVYKGKKLPDFYGCSNYPYCGHKQNIYK
ncbi:UvrD-helicase domain-containing protein [Brassicibacter mesophilus]|uniref:UvrD-helicase domain-containing protein n=1 Tax=Brassicibacter mesophilus TaxID=745119 RepID=UPI003D1B947C